MVWQCRQHKEKLLLRTSSRKNDTLRERAFEGEFPPFLQPLSRKQLQPYALIIRVLSRDEQRKRSS